MVFLPSLKHYTAISITALILGSLTSFTTNPDPEDENATKNDNGSQATPQSAFPKWPAINMAYCLLLWLGAFAQKAVFGELRVGEQQLVKDRTRSYVFHKFVFLFGVLNIEEIEELLTWIAWLALVGFFVVWVAMTKMRSEYICQSPHTSKLTHVKFLGVLIIILGCSALLFIVALAMEPIQTDYRLDYLIFIAAECLILGLKALHAIAKHCIHVYDEARPGTWENQAVVTYYTDLVCELAMLGIDFIHHVHMMIWANVILSMASLVIFMQLRTLYADIRKRLDKHRNFIRVSQSLETRFPLATKEQLEGNDDNCAICWDKMENARSLPCGHLFHLSCLRSWLEQDTSCPTCRVSLGELPETAMPTANSGARPPTLNSPQIIDSAPFLRNRHERRQNDVFRFDGRQFASWLPVVSLQVVHGQGRHRAAGELERMARVVQDVLPNVPTDAIMRDLMQTRSANQTVQNLLERAPFQEVTELATTSTRLRAPLESPTSASEPCPPEAVATKEAVAEKVGEPPEGGDQKMDSASDCEEGSESHLQAEVVLPSELLDLDGEKEGNCQSADRSNTENYHSDNNNINGSSGTRAYTSSIETDV